MALQAWRGQALVVEGLELVVLQRLEEEHTNPQLRAQIELQGELHQLVVAVGRELLAVVPGAYLKSLVAAHRALHLALEEVGCGLASEEEGGHQQPRLNPHVEGHTGP